jgi:energy-coupling factor transporter ATP-binding protein EcfA2
MNYNNHLKQINSPRNQNESSCDLDTQLREWTLTKEDVADIEDSVMIYPNTIAKSKHTIVVADTGAGKTTIFLMIAAYLQKQGFEVSYFDYDSPQDDMKQYALYAEENSFQYITENKTNVEGHLLIPKLLEMVKKVSPENASNKVFIFDTMRTFTNDIEPKFTTNFLLGVRKLTQFGVTSISLHHNNKRPELDGSGMFAGLNNVKTNCDNLIYLTAEFHDNGSITVSSETNPPKAKRRSNTKNMSWQIKDRVAVALEEFVPILTIHESDKLAISKIKETLLKHGELNESRIQELIKEEKIVSRRDVKRILMTYRGKEFQYRVGDKNANLYSIKFNSPNTSLYG